jgi:phosphotransferase system  glucose/maltose/N-acetylglucosamine-specific IIC component
MAKHEDNAVIFLLCVVIGILFVVLAFFLMRLLTVDAQLVRNKREVDKAIVLLREEREKFKAAKDAEKGTE